MKKLSNTARRAAHTALGLLLALSATHSGAIDLVGAYQQALQHDPTSLAANDALAAGSEKAVQGDALLRPRVNLQVGVSRIHDHSTSDAPPALAALAPADSTGTARQAAVELVQPLYDKTATTTRQQLHEQSALAQTQFKQSRQDLALRVADAYFGVVVAEETLRVAQAEKAAIRQQRDRAKARFEIGQSKITDLHEAQARLDGVETREVSAHSALELRRAQFLETVGMPPVQLSGLAPSFVPLQPQPDNLLAWQAKGDEQNSFVKAKRSELEIALAEIDKHRLAGRPSLALVARYAAMGQSGSLSPLVASSGDRAASVGLQLNIPLYAGGGLDSREREAIAKRSQTEQEVAAARRDMRLKVQDGFLAVKTGVSRIAASEQALVSARSALEATTLGRDVGTRTELDVLDAQHRVYGADLDLIQARVDYLMGHLRLADAAGELSQDNLRSLSVWLASR
jgi:outer membrane protein